MCAYGLLSRAVVVAAGFCVPGRLPSTYRPSSRLVALQPCGGSGSSISICPSGLLSRVSSGEPVGLAGSVSPFSTKPTTTSRKTDSGSGCRSTVDVLDRRGHGVVANVRRFLSDGELPPAGAVRTEELINCARSATRAVRRRSVLDHDRARRLPVEIEASTGADRPAGTGASSRATRLPGLVFLIDVSGSMRPADKLPLVRTAMRMLCDVLTERDRVAIVVYAGAVGLVPPSTSGDRRSASTRRSSSSSRAVRPTEHQDHAGLPGGSQQLHSWWREPRHPGQPMATSVGVTSQSELVQLIEHERESGIFLSVLGVGTGNLKDSTMEKLADKNGNMCTIWTRCTRRERCWCAKWAERWRRLPRT